MPDAPKPATWPPLFAPRDTVVWDPAKRGQGYHPSEQYGEGPFVVVACKAVPSACSYPATFCATGTHHPTCDALNSQYVGHPQWVSVQSVSEEPEGTAKKAESISGAWFIHA